MQHIYEQQKDWKGPVVLFNGARTGMETLYRNDIKDDLGNYFDREPLSDQGTIYKKCPFYWGNLRVKFSRILFQR